MENLVAFLNSDFLGHATWMWLMFLGIVVVLLSLDLGIFHRGPKEIGARESLITSGCYVLLAMGFGAWLWHELGAVPAKEYLTGYFVELSLSMDNVFVMALIFGYFNVPRQYQHRVLFWGILGVIVFRAIMIALGATLVSQFEWVLYLFGAFLIYTGFKMLTMMDHAPNLDDNALLKFLRRHMRVTDRLHEERFFVRQQDPKTQKMAVYSTPLFLALCLIEMADIVFAVDSVPAIFAITTDPFIVYTSNIFAILGLRSLYFALSAMIHRFKYLKYALAAVLVFIGGKIFIAHIFGKLPAEVSLGITVALLAGGVFYSLWKTRGDSGSSATPK